MNIINPNTDTLWKVAYGREATQEEIDSFYKLPEEEALNKVAGKIIYGHREGKVVSMAAAIATPIITAIALLIVFYYSKSSNIPTERFIIGFSVLPTFGLILTGVFGYLWYQNAKGFHEDKTEPLIEIIKRLGRDLEEIQNPSNYHKDGNALDRDALSDDWSKLFNALQPFATKV